MDCDSPRLVSHARDSVISRATVLQGTGSLGGETKDPVNLDRAALQRPRAEEGYLKCIIRSVTSALTLITHSTIFASPFVDLGLHS